MNTWKNSGAHIVGYLLAVLPVVQQFAPVAIPAYGAAIAGAAGALVLAIHQIQKNLDASNTLPQPSGRVSAALPFLFGMLLAAASMVGLSACKTAPTQTQQSAISIAVDLATGFAIQQGSNDLTVWKSRATQFKAIAIEVEKVNNAGTLTLATLEADLQPLIAKLGPADVLAANALVAALTPYVNQQVAANPTVANIQAAIELLLEAVITTCTQYGA